MWWTFRLSLVPTKKLFNIMLASLVNYINARKDSMCSIYFRATNIWAGEAVWAEKVLVLQWKGRDGSFAQRHGDTGTGHILLNVYKIYQTKNNLLLSTLVRNLQRITDTNQINTTQVSQLTWNNSKWTALNSKVYENMTYNLQVIKYGIA